LKNERVSEKKVSKDLHERQNGADANVAEAGAEEQKGVDLFEIGTHVSEPAKALLENTELSKESRTRNAKRAEHFPLRRSCCGAFFLE
jgi:hypothetical protein